MKHLAYADLHNINRHTVFDPYWTIGELAIAFLCRCRQWHVEELLRVG